MPRPRFQNLEQDKRQQILQAALEEFADCGFEAASYNQIIARAGISKGAMYYYFDDKADLYVTVLEWVTAQQHAMAASLDPALPFWEMLRQWSRLAMNFAVEHPEMWAFARSFLKIAPGVLGARQEDFNRQWRTQSELLLRQGQQMGQVREDLSLELMISLMSNLGETFDRWWLEKYDAPDEATREQLVDLAMNLFKRLLGSPQVASEAFLREEDAS